MAKKQGPLGTFAKPYKIPPLTGGWNARDPLAAQPEGDAAILTNFIPGTGGISMRGGNLSFASGIGGPCTSMFEYNAASGAEKLFVGSGADIFDVSGGGQVGAPAVSGLTSDDWHAVMFGTPAPANYLVIGNGSDPVQEFDGTSWSVPTITGVTGGKSISGASILSIASPAVVTWAAHGLAIGAQFAFATTGTLPAGVVASQTYYIIAAGFTSGSFEFSDTPGGAAIVTSGSQTGTQTVSANSSSALTKPAAIASRIFFIEKNSLRIWYLPTGAIQGAATLFDLSQQCALGGVLISMTTWSQDGGAGPNDYSAFFTSAGEVVIYAGIDPSSVTTWSKVGTFRIAEPVGNKCTLKSGADVAVITTLGVVPLSAVLPISISGQGRAAVTDKIKGAFQAAALATGLLPGWQIIEYPRGALVIVNVPQADGVSFQQYVMNTVTGSWCNFESLNGLSWCLFGQNIYFGDTLGNVFEYDAGTTDNDNPIVGTALPAFSDFGTPGFKQFVMARPLYNALPGTAPPVAVRLDYDLTPPSGGQGTVPQGGSPWDTSPWDTSPWGATLTAISEWQSIEGIGQVGSVILQAASLTGLTLNHIDVIIQDGGMF